MNKFIKALKHLVVFIVAVLYLRYIFIFVVIWGVIEIFVLAIRTKNGKRIMEFFCGLMVNVFNCIDILSNIVFQVPANRLLIKNPDINRFGSPNVPFTRILRVSFVKHNLKPRGISLYKIIQFFKNLLK